MSYSFRWSINHAPEARTDGSGGVDWDMSVDASSDEVNWVVVPGRHATFSVPATALKTVNDLPETTLMQKWAKAGALAELLTSSILNPQPISVAGWDETSLQTLMAANDSAALERDRAAAFAACRYLATAIQSSSSGKVVL